MKECYSKYLEAANISTYDELVDGTMDMIFTARQVQEKCREQHQDLLMVFIDLTKAGQGRTLAGSVENRMSTEVCKHNTFTS